ncbi:MAG TPA: PEGA domain-containing protein [Myxococcaceae bacterium]|nr:PEGA domain-containing protein [Myxococcaceae bacterium]
MSVLTSGECRDAELAEHASAVARRLAERQDVDFLKPDQLAEELRPTPPKSLADCEKQIGAARASFYNTEYARARAQLEEAVQGLERLPGGDARWKLTREAWLLHGLVQRSEYPKSDAHEPSFRRVLRLEPNHVMDPVHFSPKTRATFESVRKDLVREKKVRFSAQSSPPGADVFLDGFPVGQTPLVLSLPAGSYQLLMSRGNAVSFTRTVEISEANATAEVNLAWEGATQARPLPCLALDDETARLGAATQLGAQLGLEELVMVRVERRGAGPTWLTAADVNVRTGQKVREGGLKVQGGSVPTKALDDLVAFVLTGEPRQAVVTGNSQSVPPWLQPPDPRLEARRRTLRWTSYAGLGAAAACLGGALLVRVGTQSYIDALNSRLSKEEGYGVSGDTEADRLGSSIRSRQTVITGLLVGAGVTAAAGGALWFMSRPPAVPKISMTASPAPGGGQMFIGGAF